MSTNPFAFEVNGKTFFAPHRGAGCWCRKPSCTAQQLTILRRLAGRVMRGEGPSKYFLRGKRGGGKSIVIRKGLLHGLAMALPMLRYAVVRRNMPDLRSNHLDYLGAEMRTLGGSFHETFGQAHYANGSLGLYRQCEDERDVEKVVGSEVHILFVDEAPQIKWEYLRMMSPSVRVAQREDGLQPWWSLEVYSGNPIGESIDELDHYFVEKDVEPFDDEEYDPREFCHIPIHLEDNASLDPKEYRKQFAGLPLHYRKAWLDGERMDSRTLFDVRKTIDTDVLIKHGGQVRDQPLPVSMLGQPYHYIQELPAVNDVPLLKVPWIQVYRAFDLGYFPDPAVCVWLAVLGRRVIAFHEETWFRTIVKDLAEKIVEITNELIGATPVSMTLIDPKMAEQRNDVVTMRDIMEMHGVPCEPSINDRILYADAIHGLLGEELEPGMPRFQIYEPGCPMLAKYLPKMRWDETNERKMADHKFDHWPIAVAYFGISSGVLSVTRQEEVQTEPIWMQWIREGQQRPGRRVRI